MSQLIGGAERRTWKMWRGRPSDMQFIHTVDGLLMPLPRAHRSHSRMTRLAVKDLPVPGRPLTYRAAPCGQSAPGEPARQPLRGRGRRCLQGCTTAWLVCKQPYRAVRHMALNLGAQLGELLPAAQRALSCRSGGGL